MFFVSFQYKTSENQLFFINFTVQSIWIIIIIITTTIITSITITTTTTNT